jgi:hypothetical protein
VPRGGAHGVDVAVVVEGFVLAPFAPPVAAPVAAEPLLVPPEVLVAPAPPAEDDEVLAVAVDVAGAVAVGGGAAGAGVTFGVATGTDKETYGSSTTVAGCTMPWLVAALTIRGGVSSSETDSSAWRCALCSSDSWCCSADKRTCPFASKACATTTARRETTTIDTDTMLSTRRRFASSRRMRPG